MDLEKRVEILEKRIDKLESEKMNEKLNGLKVGDTFELAGLTWTILDVTEDWYKCIAERFEDGMVFDDGSNDWRTSILREYLNEDFYNRLASEIGEDNIILFERDLLSLDGQTEYASCDDKVSLLTVDEYRKYRKLIPNPDYWQWLITPWSTPCNGYYRSVTAISPYGCFDDYDCNNRYGVRPFCILKSNILVLKGEE